jgi:release factor glutamine methyltransferase
VTITAPSPLSGVYQPQEDSLLLIDALKRNLPVDGRTVLDLCTGSGVVAIAAAGLGAGSVTAWDVNPLAVDATRLNAAVAGVTVDVRLGCWSNAHGRFDLVLANPPYVPVGEGHSAVEGPASAWDAGPDGRLVIDPLCAAAPRLLTDRGSLLFVQSELSGIEESLELLAASGLRASVVARQRIPFGPVLLSRAEWLERTGRSPVGCREENLVVIRADRG